MGKHPLNMKGMLSKKTSDFKMSLNIFTNPQERLNLIKFDQICITVTGLPSVIIFTGSGLVEIIAPRLPPNLTDAHLLLTAVQRLSV